MISVGIVGCGYWGPKHVRNFHELADARLAAVCDTDERKTRQVKAQYPDVETLNDYDAFLDLDIEGIVIATPVKSHFKLAKKALEHGKNVLIEKPIASDSSQALELIELSEKNGLVLMVGHTYEYHPAVEYLRQAAANGEFGDILGVDSDRLNLGLFRPDVNVLWDLAPHDICIVLSLLGEEPVAVSARGSCHVDPNTCDLAYLELLFSNGTIGHIHVSWLHPRKIRQTTIVGSRRMAVYDDVSENEKVLIYDKGLSLGGNGENKFSAWPPNYRYGDVLIPYISGAEPLKLECSHFVKCIADGTTPRSDGWSGLRVLKILEAADRSMANEGQRVKIRPVSVEA
jgi:predicted dehydrogenase